VTPIPPGIAWASLCLAVALHVADEAAHGFLAVYNPAVIGVKQQLPWLPLPTFTFEVWIAGLAFAVLLGLSLTPFVVRRERWMRLVVVAVAALMILNALLHFAGSIAMGAVMPGAHSSPILAAVAGGALLSATKYWSRPACAP
jgi:hypothetical protein